MATEGRWATLARFVLDNLVDSATVAVALYALVRGLLSGFTSKDVPFLLSTIVGLLALHSIDGFIERQGRLREITNTVRSVGASAHQVSSELGTIRDGVEGVALAVSGLRLGASATQLLVDAPEVPRDRLVHATKILWCGVTLRSSLRQRLPDLRAAISHGADICLLVVDPSKVRLKDELTFREGVKYEYIDAVLKSTVLNLQLLSNNVPAGGQYYLGLHRVLPTYGLLIIDPDDSDGICYLELYHPDMGRQCSIVIHATADAAWFSFFVDQFEAMRRQAEVYRIRTPADVELAVTRGTPDGP